MLRIVSQVKPNARYVPLKQVNIESTIGSFAADVTITQIFRNDSPTSAVGVYCFPIEEQAAVYKFTARVDGREIVAQLKEKGNILGEHSDRRARADAAYLLEQDEKCQDNFIINIGILPPAKECLISISYVTELELVHGSIIRFVIPATIAPRYSPLRKASMPAKHVQSTPYAIDVRCRVEKFHGSSREPCITQLASPSHHVDIDLTVPDAYVVTFVQNDSYLDRDILIDITLSDKRANTFVVVESGAAMAAVTPFEGDCYIAPDDPHTNEFIFVVDCSGSMRNENRIGLAREAMLFFLKNLPTRCCFNIIKFGARFSCLFDESAPFYHQANVRLAEQFISQIRADLGGTEILAPLQWLEQHPPQSNRVRQIFLLTDGQVTNVSEVLALCRSMAPFTRIFSFGLGAAPSRALVKGLARATNGRFVFIPPHTSIDSYIGEQLQKAMRHCITNIRVEWNLGVPVENVPDQLPPAYLDDRLIVYALAGDRPIAPTPGSAIEIRTDHSYYRLNVTESDCLTHSNRMIERLAAKALILQLEHCKTPPTTPKKVRFERTNDENLADRNAHRVSSSAQRLKQRIIELSLRYNILSPYTTFVGVEKHLAGEDTAVNLREIPIEISVSTRRSPSPKSRRASGNRSTPSERPVASRSESNARLDAKNTIYFLMQKQAADGLWYFVSNSRVIEDLTGRPLAAFQTFETRAGTPIVVTAIIIVLLESRFDSLRSMWEDMTDRARQGLVALLNNDWKTLVTLFRNVRRTLAG